jgi:hypothetical protein
MILENIFAGLEVEPSDEDRARNAERLRRLTSIAQGIHPSTGKRLRRADLKGLSGASERFQAELWLAVNPAPGQVLGDRLVKNAQRSFFRVAQKEDFVDRAHRYAEGFLAELSLVFERDRNPMHAWEAYQLARINKHDLPEWVLQYLDRAAEALIELRDGAADGNPPEREAETVGKAIGFGKRRGETGYLTGAAMLLRDLQMHFDVKDQIEQKKARYNTAKVRTIVIEDVAKMHDVDPATVRRAAERMRALFKDDD